MRTLLMLAMILSGSPRPVPLAQLPINPNTGNHIVRSDREVALSLGVGEEVHLDVPEQVMAVATGGGSIYDARTIDTDTLWITANNPGRSTIVAKTKRSRRILIHLEVIKK